LISEVDIFDDQLILDNLLALKVLEQEFPGKMKCVLSTRHTTPVARLRFERKA